MLNFGGLLESRILVADAQVYFVSDAKGHKICFIGLCIRGLTLIVFGPFNASEARKWSTEIYKPDLECFWVIFLLKAIRFWNAWNALARCRKIEVIDSNKIFQILQFAALCRCWARTLINASGNLRSLWLGGIWTKGAEMDLVRFKNGKT